MSCQSGFLSMLCSPCYLESSQIHQDLLQPTMGGAVGTT
jgi:hypothetical protein